VLMKRKVYLFAISLAFIATFLNIAPLVVHHSLGNNSLPTTNATPSSHNELSPLVAPAPTGAAPVAFDDSYSTDEDTPLTVSAPGVLGNDNDVDGDPLSVTLVTLPTHGSVTLSPDGSFSYTPNHDYFGSDTFVYHANDGQFDSNPATVTITISPVNDAPVAVDDVYTTDEDTILYVYSGVRANDYDVDRFDYISSLLVDGPAHGSLEFYLEGAFSYTPAPDWYGIDHFEYRNYDTFVYGNIATVTIIVNPVNDAPVAHNDTFTMDEDTVLPIFASALLSNDSDVDGDSLQVTILTSPSFGTLLEVLPGQEFTYTPNPDWYGTDSFTYQAFDGLAYSSVAQVTITVLNVIDDITPPTTEILFSGTRGDNGWFISPVVVTLTATDDFSVASTMYSPDGKNWLPYTGPFTISTDGINTTYYYSIDTAGNRESTKSASIIIDTDITGPIITIIYTGGGTDGNPGYWTITAVDPESGIDTITVEVDGILVGTLSGDYAVPNSLGLHTIRVNATNNDLKVGMEDQEFSTLSASVTIVDDDTTGPQITIVYAGESTVSDPGFWTVTAEDPESGIATLTVEIDGEIVGTTAGDYAVPASVGTHTITVTAYNGDLDRGDADQEMSVQSASATISAESTPGWVTGVGWITDAKGNRGQFAFLVKLKPNGDISGVFLYSFKVGKTTYMVKSTEILEVGIDGNHAYFVAMCSVTMLNLHNCRIHRGDDGYLVRVDVWDNPGRCTKDIFQIRIYDPSGQVWHEAGFSPTGYVHGDIVIHIYRYWRLFHNDCGKQANKHMKWSHCHCGRW
jgi:VCBS repeat-containing protein